MGMIKLGLKVLSGSRAARLSSRASAAAREKRWSDAAILYEAALRLKPNQPRLHVQAGHMWKESGDFRTAEHHYSIAAQSMPDDPDLALQRGHLYRLCGRLDEAQLAYEGAIHLSPDWPEPRRALAVLGTTKLRRADVDRNAIADDGQLLAPASDLLLAEFNNHVLPEYFPTGGVRPLPHRGISIRRLGRFEHTPWGVLRTLQGIEAIQAHFITSESIDEVHVLLGDALIHKELARPHIMNSKDGQLYKYVSNIWIDLSDYIPGRHHFELIYRAGLNSRLDDGASHREFINIIPPISEPTLSGSESWTPPVAANRSGSLADEINSRPSVVRAATAQAIPIPQSVLLLRTDQLGDLAVSVPAILRLRDLLPNAQIVGLFTSANVEAAQALNVFDKVLVADFPDVLEERQRVMSAAEQERLQRTLGAFCFDVAIDLAPAEISRSLLLLSGAKLTMGFGGQSFPWLGAKFDFELRDDRGRASILSSSAKTLALIEALGTLFNQKNVKLEVEPALHGELASFGLNLADKFIVLHSGARIAFSRWPYYPQLAKRLISEYDTKVVLLNTDPAVTATIPKELLQDRKFIHVECNLPFPALKALLAFSTLFIGNDTGPKHLASLLGANVISIHSARANWGEWGQSRGLVITRQIPCASCHIYHDQEECGRDFVCITRISVEEVLNAARHYLVSLGSPA